MSAYRRYSFEEVSRLDRDLFQLASYDITNGLLIIPETPEEEAEQARKTITRFNQLKRLIQTGECTYEYIHDTILARCGAYYHKELHRTIDEEIDSVIEEAEKKFNEPEETEDYKSTIGLADDMINKKVEDLLYQMTLMAQCIRNQEMLENTANQITKFQDEQDDLKRTGFRKFDEPESEPEDEDEKNDDEDRGSTAANQ